MTLRADLSRAISRTLTSPRLRQWRADGHSALRRATGAPAVIHYFHQADDPYSQLAAGLLPTLRERYRVQLVPHLVSPPDRAAAPEAERLAAWARRDAARLARFLALPWHPVSAGGSPSLDDLRSSIADAALHLQQSDRLRRRLGHYLGATFHFEGEWYWGVDRLHYLEARLRDAGLLLPGAPAAPIALPREPGGDVLPPALQPPVLDFFCSLRSPYTYLAAARVRRLAERHGAELRLRFVLPMVMRGLPVPAAKRRYILLDAKREAERLGLAFGTVVDPVGTPTEQGLALLHRAIALGLGPRLLESFLAGVFAEGIDAGSTRGLQAIALRAEFSPGEIADALRDPTWRDVAEANRAELLELGLWGVPSFRVQGFEALWGQDRLWAVEEDLLAARRALSQAAIRS